MEAIQESNQERKTLSRAIRQTKLRQVGHSQKYMFGFLIPENCLEALEFDKTNNNSKWNDATRAEIDSINKYNVFQNGEKAKFDENR